jgi:hypothetical protein
LTCPGADATIARLAISGHEIPLSSIMALPGGIAMRRDGVPSANLPPAMLHHNKNMDLPAA